MKEPKLKTVYVCSNCGETSPRWMGRCPSCGSWNTMNEDVVAEAPKAGMTLAVEPMINAGSPDVEWMDDEWTVVTYDGSLSAHYENTILITEGRPEILTLTEEERECIWQE